MRWVSFRDGDGAARVGLVVDGDVHALRRGTTLLGLLGDGGQRLRDAGERARSDPDEVVARDRVDLLPPIPHPPALRDFYAFEEHVATARRARGLEMHPDWYELPVFYFSNPHRLVGHGAEVAIPDGSEAMDYELEVAAVVGRAGSDLTPDEGTAAIAGFAVMNDWSARDLQRREMQLNLGPAKGKDFATSLGPELVTPDELEAHRDGDGWDLAMTATVRRAGRDEEVEHSRGTLADLHWSFGEMIAYASRDSRVETGDVIGSGTVGTGCLLELSLVHGEGTHPWLGPGDEVTLAVDRLGVLTNRVVAGPQHR